MKDFFETLKSCPLFMGIDEKDLDALLPCLNAVTSSYEKHQSILLEGDPANYVGLVLYGMVHIVKEDFYGNRNIVSEVYPGELFAEVFACADTKFMPVSVFASEKSFVMLMDCKKLLTTCGSGCDFHNTLISNLIHILAHKSLILNQKIDLLSKRSTRDKLLAYLSSVAKASSASEFSIPFNRQELADFLCIDRSAMSSELGKMKKDGLIDFNKNKFTLL